MSRGEKKSKNKENSEEYNLTFAPPPPPRREEKSKLKGRKGKKEGNSTQISKMG